MPSYGATSAAIAAQPQAAPPASDPNAVATRTPNSVLGLRVERNQPSGAGSEFDGEVNAATDLERMYNQVLSAPPTAAPAAPPTNYYEGIEKKLAALQEAETGPDLGMALLRAGLVSLKRAVRVRAPPLQSVRVVLLASMPTKLTKKQSKRVRCN